jgi:hypothetical protein
VLLSCSISKYETVAMKIQPYTVEAEEGGTGQRCGNIPGGVRVPYLAGASSVAERVGETSAQHGVDFAVKCSSMRRNLYI